MTQGARGVCTGLCVRTHVLHSVTGGHWGDGGGGGEGVDGDGEARRRLMPPAADHLKAQGKGGMERKKANFVKSRGGLHKKDAISKSKKKMAVQATIPDPMKVKQWVHCRAASPSPPSPSTALYLQLLRVRYASYVD